jgi:hypothetical protein
LKTGAAVPPFLPLLLETGDLNMTATLNVTPTGAVKPKLTEKDFTPTGVCIEGAYENDRNAESSDLFKSIIREAYGVQDVIIAHHLVYVTEETRSDGFKYQIVEEVPSADTLIFDHKVAEKLWGAGFKDVLVKLVLEPVETRDALLASLYAARKAN